MSPSPFTPIPETVELPPDLSPHPLTAVQQVWDAARGYWNAGAPAQLDQIAALESVISQAIS
jgi:hypothetical protein